MLVCVIKCLVNNIIFVTTMRNLLGPERAEWYSVDTGSQGRIDTGSKGGTAWVRPGIQGTCSTRWGLDTYVAGLAVLQHYPLPLPGWLGTQLEGAEECFAVVGFQYGREAQTESFGD